MGYFDRLRGDSRPLRMRASADEYAQAFFSGTDMPDAWMSSLVAAGVPVTPELAMTLSAYYCGVTTIAYDLATLPANVFKTRADGGKDLVLGSSTDVLGGGISDLAYLLRWAPNAHQTATEYFVGQIAQLLLRGKAYAEIVDGPSGFLSQLLPRHPDRVTPERLPNGNLRYKLLEANGTTRFVTQQEMHVVRDLATDPVSTVSRVAYGAGTIGTALAAERAAGKFFKSGMTAAVTATYEGELDEEDERQLHGSITRYAAGVENNFGLLLIPDKVTVGNLGIEPEKAQMMLAREWTVFEVARQLRISPRKLMVRTAGVTGYASAYQDAIDHVVGCIRPWAVTLEQAIQRDLILEKDTYVVKFHLRELLQGDPVQLGELIEKLIRNRVMTPSEVRMAFMDLNPDPHLDLLSESDNQPGRPGTQPPPDDSRPAPPKIAPGKAQVKALLAVHANAVRCLRRERAAVEKLARKHASDVDGWKASLQDFYRDHATFVAEIMRVPSSIAAGYAASHGTACATDGAKVLLDDEAYADWERVEADDLTALALNDFSLEGSVHV